MNRKKATPAAAEAVEPLAAPVSENSKARHVSLDKAVGDLNKRYGDGTIMRLGEATHLQIDSIPTGSIALDLALGIGGVPRGAWWKSTARNRPAKPRCASTSWPKRKNAAACARILTWNTRSTRCTPPVAAWT